MGRSCICWRLRSFASKNVSFRASEHFRDQPSTYLDSANQIYLDVRRSLSTMAHNGDLSAKQILTAKKIIFQFNKQSVDAMVALLSLNQELRHPDKLIAMIKDKMRDSSVEKSTKLKVKEVVYFKKLKAVKQLVMLLDLTEEDVGISENTPEDLRLEHRSSVIPKYRPHIITCSLFPGGTYLEAQRLRSHSVPTTAHVGVA